MRVATRIAKAKNSRAFLCLWYTRGIEALCGLVCFFIYSLYEFIHQLHQIFDLLSKKNFVEYPTDKSILRFHRSPSIIAYRKQFRLLLAVVAMCEQLSERQQSCSSISQLLVCSFGVVILFVAAPGFRRFVADLSSRMPEFDYRPVDVGFVAAKMAL